MNNFDTVREALTLAANTSAYMCIENAVARDACKDALSALAELERTHFTSEDVADASADGFRAGVASVTAGKEPVAWLVCSVNSDGSLSLEHAAAWKEAAHEHINDAITEHGIEDAASWVVRPAYDAAPVAQQPQTRPDFNDEWTGYLKDGETPFERFLRERKDLNALTKLYQRVLEENERLKAQQPRQCGLCGSDEAFTGTCGGGRRDPRALCYEPVAQQPQCWCTTCRPNTVSDMRFVVCPACGNKRCPRAHNHALACTGSNDVGQPGSAWAHIKPAQQPQADDDYKGWYCAHCQCGVDGSEVTFHGQHTVCGRVITDDRPPQQPQAKAVPPTHVLVPVEPTDAMLIAGGNDAEFCMCCGYDNGPGDCGSIWEAMIAAAQGEKP